MLLELRTVLIRRLQQVQKFIDLKLSLRHFSYMHNGLSFRHWLLTFVPYVQYAVKCGMVFKIPGSGLVFPVEANMQKYS